MRRFRLAAQLFWRVWMRQKVSWVGSYLWVWWVKRASLILHQTPAKTRRQIVSGFFWGLQSGANLCKHISEKKKKSLCPAAHLAFNSWRTRLPSKKLIQPWKWLGRKFRAAINSIRQTVKVLQSTNKHSRCTWWSPSRFLLLRKH